MYRFLEWDTSFFGFPIARCEPEGIKAFEEALTQAKQERVQCLYLLTDAQDVDLHQHLLAQPQAYQVDLRLTLACTSLPEGSLAQVQDATEQDLPWLEPIARHAHLDARFFMDPRFPREHVHRLYETWISRSVRGWAQRVFTSRNEDGEALGYVTAHLEGDVGSIGLVALSPSARGLGLGTRMIGQALAWFRAQGVSKVEVITQGRNVAAQRLYQRHGFRTTNAQIWYHLWL